MEDIRPVGDQNEVLRMAMTPQMLRTVEMALDIPDDDSRSPDEILDSRTSIRNVA